MAKTFSAMNNFPTVLQTVLVTIVMLSIVPTVNGKTEVDILWEKYGELKADIEKLKARLQTGDGSCMPSTAEPTIIPQSPTTPIPTGTTRDKDGMTDIGYELLSVTKTDNDASNETEITVTLLAPEDAIFYWFESMSQFIPAYEDGEFATVKRRGGLTQVKLKKHLRDYRHLFVSFSEFSAVMVRIQTESNKQVFSTSEQNCKYSNVKYWETDSTFNSDITFHCNPMLNNLTITPEIQFLSQLKKDSKSVEITQTMEDSTDFNVSQTEENDGRFSITYSINKEKYVDSYSWIDNVIFLSTKGNELVEGISFIVLAKKTMNGGMHPLFPPGRIGFYRIQDIVFIEDEDGYVPCFAMGNYAPDLRIAKRDTKFGDISYFTPRSQYKALGDVGFTWTKLTSVSLTDAGEYCCLATLNGKTASMNFSISVRPKDYTFYVEDISKNMTADGMINATFQAIGSTDIDVSCDFINVEYNSEINMELNDTVTSKKISTSQALLTYTALVDPKVVSMGTNGIECFVNDVYSTKYVFIDLYMVN